MVLRPVTLHRTLLGQARKSEQQRSAESVCETRTDSLIALIFAVMANEAIRSSVQGFLRCVQEVVVVIGALLPENRLCVRS